MPEPPSGDRSQRADAGIERSLQRHTANFVQRLQRRVEIGDPRKRIGAGRRVPSDFRKLGKLPVERALGLAKLHIDKPAAIGVLPVVIGRQRDFQRVGRLEQQLRAATDIVLPVDLRIGMRVQHIAVTIGRRHRQADRNTVAQRPRYRALQLVEPFVTDRSLTARGEIECRLARGDIDRARRRVLAIQRALWPAQHFDPVDIEKVESRRSGARVVDIVDIDPDTRLDAVVGQAERCAEPANVERRVARVLREKLQGRRQLLDPVDIERAGAVDMRAVEHRQRDRHRLRSFGTVARGDQDDAVIHDIRRGRCRSCGRRRIGSRGERRVCGDQRQRRDSSQQRTERHDVNSLK